MSERTIIGGVSYETIGSSSSNLLLKCNGTARIQWGNKIIEYVLKNEGYNVVNIGVFNPDGIYVLTADGGDQLWIYKNGEKYNLTRTDLYISANNKQDLTAEQKTQALENVGFYFNTLEEANELINSGFDEVIEEADRLNELGVENMSPREKALFVELTNHIKTHDTNIELEKMGVGRDVYDSAEFQTFASQFNSNVPIADIFKYYNQSKPKKEIKTMGSVKNTTSDSGVKDYYSPEEAKKFSLKDLQSNPALANAIERSMLKWK